MEEWSSTWGFILAAVGSAVGLGNIWRFPSVLGENGGGAYLIPYMLAFFCLALPLVIIEIKAGQKYRENIVSAFRSINPKFTALGWIITAVLFTILSYYLVIAGWTMGYTALSSIGMETTFSSFTSGLLPVYFFILTALITGFIVSKGVVDGIERFVKYVIPLIFVILVLLVIYSTTLPGFGEGMSFMFSPDFSVLTNPWLWAAALGQAFFSFSAGEGIMMTYGSYFESDKDVLKSCLAIGVADFTAAILAGMVIFPVVFSTGLEPAAGSELAFTTLPRAFAQLPFSRVLKTVFFGILSLAALTSSISMMEVVVSVLKKNLSWSRIKSSTATTSVLLVTGMFSAISYSSAGFDVMGVPFLDLLDELAGTIGLLLTSVILSVVLAWFTDLEELINLGKLTRPMVMVTKYVLPLMATFLLISEIVTKLGEAGVNISLTGAATTVGIPVVALAAGVLALGKLRERSS